MIRNTTEVPCNCVLRGVFRACYHRFRECDALGERTSPVTLEFCQGAEGRRAYARKREDFMSDFDLVSRRALHADEYRLFRYHYLLGADWRLCCRQLNLSRGNFFHAVYHIEQKLGRIFAELKPYPLYPVDEYFTGTISHQNAA